MRRSVIDTVKVMTVYDPPRTNKWPIVKYEERLNYIINSLKLLIENYKNVVTPGNQLW